MSKLKFLFLAVAVFALIFVIGFASEPVAVPPGYQALADQIRSAMTDNLKSETIRKGADLQFMAKTYYGDSLGWPLVWFFNTDTVANPELVEAGTKLKIPRLKAGISTEESSKALENAYILVYYLYANDGKHTKAQRQWVLGQAKSAGLDLKGQAWAGILTSDDVAWVNGQKLSTVAKTVVVPKAVVLDTKQTKAVIALAAKADEKALEELILKAQNNNALDDLQGDLETEAAKPEADTKPEIHFALALTYGRKGLKTQEYAALVKAEEAAKKPGVNFNIAIIYGRKQLLENDVDADKFLESTITVSSEPAGAKVYLNDKLLGPTPLVDFKTRTGTYKLRIEKYGYESMIKEVYLPIAKTTEETQTMGAKRFEGKTLRILTQSDELSTNGVVNYFEQLTGATVSIEVLDNSKYFEEFKKRAKTPDSLPDIFIGEEGFAKEILSLGLSDTLSDEPYNADTNGMFQYAKQMGLDSSGKLKALTWQTAPGGFVYRRSLAKKTFGTDDPVEVQKHFETWDLVLESGALLKKNGVFLLPNITDLAHVFKSNKSAPFFDANNKWNLDPIIKQYFTLAKKIHDSKYDANFGTWSGDWTGNMNTTPERAVVFGYALPTWAVPNLLESQRNSYGDWGIVRLPVSWFWGGIWLNIYDKSPNKELAWEFLNLLTQDRKYLKDYALKTKDFVSDISLVKEIAKTIKTDLFSGQNHYEFFMKEAEKINASMVSGGDSDMDSIITEVLNKYVNGGYSSIDAAMSAIVAQAKSKFPKGKF